METKHFLKTLILFMVIIIFGLIGVFLVDYFDGENNGNISDNVGVAK